MNNYFVFCNQVQLNFGVLTPTLRVTYDHEQKAAINNTEIP